MRAATEAAPMRRHATIAGLALAGFALSLFVFYPGVMSYDALYVYQTVADGRVGDWQSPVMTALWALIDPLAPGPASLFLLTAALYWLGFGLIAATLARCSLTLGVVAVLLALVPPAFMFVGMIWRDVLFAGVWLVAAGLIFATARARAGVRWPVQLFAIALVTLGVTLRPNALFAAPILIAYALWPCGLSFKRAALVFVPAVLVTYGVVQVTFYNVFGAMRQHPLHSLYVFDLGGISHFTKENQFPVTWSHAEEQRLLNDCYARLWDVYWYGRACEFVMQRIEKDEKLFGTPALAAAWRQALIAHPIAYARHRLAFMRGFLAGENFTIWTQDLQDGSKIALPDKPGFVALLAVHDRLKPTPLFRAASWALLCVVVFGVAWRRGNGDEPASPSSCPRLSRASTRPPPQPSPACGGGSEQRSREGAWTVGTPTLGYEPGTKDFPSGSSAQADDPVRSGAGIQVEGSSNTGCSAFAEHDKKCAPDTCGTSPAMTASRAPAQQEAARTFALAVSGSAIVYVLTYVPFGVAPDFRYVYWAVLAALTGGAALASTFAQGPGDDYTSARESVSSA